MNIFISYSGIDRNNIEVIIDKLQVIIHNLNSREYVYTLWYYNQSNKDKYTMDEIIKKLVEVDLFILLISENSLNSSNVQRELAEAIRLVKNGQIKNICPLLIDSTIHIGLDHRIPEYIKDKVISCVNSTFNVDQIIENIILNGIKEMEYDY